MGRHEASRVCRYAADVTRTNARKAVPVWGHSLECWKDGSLEVPATLNLLRSVPPQHPGLLLLFP